MSLLLCRIIIGLSTPLTPVISGHTELPRLHTLQANHLTHPEASASISFSTANPFVWSTPRRVILLCDQKELNWTQRFLQDIDHPADTVTTKFVFIRSRDAEKLCVTVHEYLHDEIPGFHVLPDTRTNRIFLMAHPRVVAKADAIIKYLDQP